jgi:hypothetical protein
MAQVHTSDVKIRWSHLLNGSVTNRPKIGASFPALAALVSNIIAPAECRHSVVIKLPNEDTIVEIREWLEENAKAKYTIFGRYEWTDLGVRVTRDVKGLCFSFQDEDMAVFFKMRWATGF